MNILFLTLSYITDISERGIYTDLMREFIKQDHTIYIVTPAERRFHQPTKVFKSDKATMLRVKTLNIQKTNLIEKGIGTLLLEYQYQQAIQKYFRDIKFDLILYSTPPITFNKVIDSLKKRDNAHTYLLLKDIFPQNAVDLEMFSKSSLFYKIFRKKEKTLYKLSDHIGCMSSANVKYVLKHNSDISPEKVEICPNCIEIASTKNTINKNVILKKYNIPADKILFIYGGNLGKPQGIDFLLNIVKANENKEHSFIIIVGNGTEYERVLSWFGAHTPHNSILLTSLPKIDYETLVSICDVGLIFLDPRFTIPNYPSRLLSYLENKKPVLIASDLSTDIGRIAEENKYGLWTENGNIEIFMNMMDELTANKEKRIFMGNNGYSFLLKNYTVEEGYKIIIKHCF